MTETKYTPGPWTRWDNDKGAFVIHGPDGAVLCQRADWDHRAAESAANASLIAAAPEMLAALQFVDAFTTAHEAAGDEIQWTDECRELIEAVRAAIAKATEG